MDVHPPRNGAIGYAPWPLWFVTKATRSEPKPKRPRAAETDLLARQEEAAGGGDDALPDLV